MNPMSFRNYLTSYFVKYLPYSKILKMKATDLNEFQLWVKFTKSVVLDMSFTQSVVYTY
jgi:hypothetical protein